MANESDKSTSQSGPDNQVNAPNQPPRRTGNDSDNDDSGCGTIILYAVGTFIVVALLIFGTCLLVLSR